MADDFVNVVCVQPVEQIDVKEMVMPLVVFDVHEKVAKNPDYTVIMNT